MCTQIFDIVCHLAFCIFVEKISYNIFDSLYSARPLVPDCVINLDFVRQLNIKKTSGFYIYFLCLVRGGYFCLAMTFIALIFLQVSCYFCLRGFYYHV